MNTRQTMTAQSLKQIEKITGEKLTLGRLIWAIRMAEESSQIEFAKLLGISRQHLCDIEHNRKTISPALAKKYAQQLQCSEEQFIRLCLQDLLDRDGVSVTVDIRSHKDKKIDQVGKVSFA